MYKSLFSLSGLCFLAACAVTPPAQDVHVVPTELTTLRVQQGVFTDGTCRGERNEHFDSCTCESDIVAAKSNDLKINAVLHRVAAYNICKGSPAEDVPETVSINQRKIDYTVTRDDGKWLSVLYNFYEMNAGAAHGMTTQKAFLYDREAERWVKQAELVAPALREGAGKAVLDQLKAADDTYDGMLWPENIDHVFTEKGCEGCTLYPTTDGWKVTFMPYSAGPYAVGLVTVPLDSGFVSK